ncbi:hypothetical protein [Parasutterella sp.]|jgi:hypothetical protein|uniref:hypothetical protein n=1 Tax=Parasutterella TaxID=577310 RepID=UPI00399AA00D
MKTLKPEFVNALGNFIASRSKEDPLENWFTRRRIVVELEWLANTKTATDCFVLYPDPADPKVFTAGYMHEAVIGGETYRIVASVNDYTGTKGTPADGVDTEC